MCESERAVRCRRRASGSALRYVAAAAAAFSIAAALVACIAQASGAASRNAKSSRGITHVTFVNDYHLEATDAGYFVAMKKGWYKKAGLTVKFLPSTGSSDAAELLATTKATFAQIAGPALQDAVGSGAPIEGVANLNPKTGFCAIVKDTSGITSPKQFVGKTVGATASTVTRELLPAALKKFHLKPTAVTFETVPSVDLLSDFEAGKIDLYGGEFDNEPNYINIALHQHVHCVTYRLPVVGYMLATRKNEIHSRPKIVGAFVKATLEGWRYAMGHPAQAVKIMKATAPSSTVTALYTNKVEAADIVSSRKLAVTPQTKDHPYGYSSPLLWKKSEALMHEYAKYPIVKPATLFTNRFVPSTLPHPGAPW